MPFLDWIHCCPFINPCPFDSPASIDALIEQYIYFSQHFCWDFFLLKISLFLLHCLCIYATMWWRWNNLSSKEHTQKRWDKSCAWEKYLFPKCLKIAWEIHYKSLNCDFESKYNFSNFLPAKNCAVIFI